MEEQLTDPRTFLVHQIESKKVAGRSESFALADARGAGIKQEAFQWLHRPHPQDGHDRWPCPS